MVTYSAWKVDHKSRSTKNKYLKKIKRGDTKMAWKVDHKLWSTNK